MLQHPVELLSSDGELGKGIKTGDVDLAITRLEAGGAGLTKGEEQRKES